jgi:hypothetical protein
MENLINLHCIVFNIVVDFDDDNNNNNNAIG